jgi:hypothetical protein
MKNQRSAFAQPFSPIILQAFSFQCSGIAGKSERMNAEDRHSQAGWMISIRP